MRVRCEWCGGQFLRELPARKEQDPDRGVCPQLLCRAKAAWTIEEWEGAARMAEARRAASIELSALDVEALRRTAGDDHATQAVAEVGAAQQARVAEIVRATRAKTTTTKRGRR